MNAADRTAQTHHLIRKQRDLEHELVGAERNVALAVAELKSRAKNVSGGVKFYEAKRDRVKDNLAAIDKAIHGTGPIAEWMLGSCAMGRPLKPRCPHCGYRRDAKHIKAKECQRAHWFGSLKPWTRKPR